MNDKEIWAKSFKDPLIAKKFDTQPGPKNNNYTSVNKHTKTSNSEKKLFYRLKNLEHDVKIIKNILRSMGKFGKQIQQIQQNQLNNNLTQKP